MSIVGKRLRMSQIFAEDGKTLIIPAESLSPDRPWDVSVKGIIEGGADAVMTIPGILRQYYDVVAGKIPVILTVPLEQSYVDLALQMDCVAVKWQYFGPMQQLPAQDILRFAVKSSEAGMPFYLELVPMTATRAEGGKQITDPDELLRACLRGVSLGADFIKTNYSGSPETFKKVTSSCPVPVTILGGERISDDACLQRIKGAMDGGAAGGAFGRNTMTHPYPAKIVRAIRKIIHEGSSIEEAKKELE